MVNVASTGARPLPRSNDDLRGLRAAHWGRESTGRQADRFGPAAQRDQRDRAIKHHGMADTGIEWLVAHSGRTVAATGEFNEMLSKAGRDYDGLVVGYVSRFARNLHTAVNARHDLHEAGAAIFFADERLLSSDEEAWGGPAYCDACGNPLKGDTRGRRNGTKVTVYRHRDGAPCPGWPVREVPTAVLDGQVAGLLDGAAPSRASAARIRAALEQPVIGPDRSAMARLDARLKTLGTEIASSCT